MKTNSIKKLKLNKYLFLSIFVLAGLLLFWVILNGDNHSGVSNAWLGEYRYEEFFPPNISRTYLITIFENDGLNARIQVDGFQTLKRLEAKVVQVGEEISFLYSGDYYTEEEKNDIYNGIYYEGDILLKLKHQKGSIITEWEELQPIEESGGASLVGEYFEKIDQILYY
jgi:hypothetical protein